MTRDVLCGVDMPLHLLLLCHGVVRWYVVTAVKVVPLFRSTLPVFFRFKARSLVRSHQFGLSSLRPARLDSPRMTLK